MNGLVEFLNMGGYAFYVWSAYGITLVVLLANLILPMWRMQRLRRSVGVHRPGGGVPPP
jgi:heme exporter protein D